jgi:hypothetical protein
MRFDRARAEPGVLVGFDSLSRSYKIYSLLTKRLRRSSEVVFRESTFPLKDPAQQVVAQLDDEVSLDLLVHGQQVGEVFRLKVLQAKGIEAIKKLFSMI